MDVPQVVIPMAVCQAIIRHHVLPFLDNLELVFENSKTGKTHVFSVNKFRVSAINILGIITPTSIMAVLKANMIVFMASIVVDSIAEKCLFFGKHTKFSKEYCKGRYVRFRNHICGPNIDMLNFMWSELYELYTIHHSILHK